MLVNVLILLRLGKKPRKEVLKMKELAEKLTFDLQISEKFNIPMTSDEFVE